VARGGSADGRRPLVRQSVIPGRRRRARNPDPPCRRRRTILPGRVRVWIPGSAPRPRN